MAEARQVIVSIILIVRDPGDSPDDVLQALYAQNPGDDVEIIVVDGRPDGVAPSERFPPSQMAYVKAPDENMPRLKARGVEVARGETVAFLEPKGIPDPGWVEALLAAVKRHPGSAIGGGVNFDGRQTAVNQAAFLFEYGGFSPDEIRTEQTLELPGNNMALPRKRLIDLCGDILNRDGLHKPFCQQRLIAGNVRIVMNPDLSVRLKTDYGFWRFVASRFDYGRCFGGTRMRFAPARRKALYVLGSPAVPFIVVFRRLSRLGRSGSVNITPGNLCVTILICLVWAAGEVTGYWMGRGKSCTRLY